jgi:Holliday junction DNA helicase RuvA
VIYKITGVLIAKNGGRVALDVHGVAYEIMVSMSSYMDLPTLGEEAALFTHFVLREDGASLYGFTKMEEKEEFLLLNTVSKVGPKLAMAILGNMGKGELAQAVVSQDVNRLSMVPGIGKRSAERIIVELKDKMKPAGVGALSAVPGSVKEDVISALCNLGYKEADSAKVVGGLTDPDFQTMLKKALAELNG